MGEKIAYDGTKRIVCNEQRTANVETQKSPEFIMNSGLS